MYRMIATTFSKAASPFRGNGDTGLTAADERPVRGRRKDDATFAVIGAVLALFFLIEFGWVIAHQSFPGLL
jgi:hypothetical protein